MRYVMLPYASINGKTVAKWDVIYDRELLTEVAIHPEVKARKTAIMVRNHPKFVAFWQEPTEKRPIWRYDIHIKDIGMLDLCRIIQSGYDGISNGHYKIISHSGTNPAVLFSNLELNITRILDYFS